MSNNLQAEIYAIVRQVKRDYKPSLSPTEASKELLQLFDKSVGEIIGQDEEEIENKFDRSPARNKLRAKQRQIWNKIKSGEEKV